VFELHAQAVLLRLALDPSDGGAIGRVTEQRIAGPGGIQTQLEDGVLFVHLALEAFFNLEERSVRPFAVLEVCLSSVERDSQLPPEPAQIPDDGAVEEDNVVRLNHLNDFVCLGRNARVCSKWRQLPHSGTHCPDVSRGGLPGQEVGT